MHKHSILNLDKKKILKDLNNNLCQKTTLDIQQKDWIPGDKTKLFALQLVKTIHTCVSTIGRHTAYLKFLSRYIFNS